jgi:hypothetical protein
VLFDDVADLQQERLPLVGLEPAPWTLESGARSGDGPVDILLVAFGDGRDQIAGRRVPAFKGFAGGGSDPLAVDQHAFDVTTGDKGMPRSFDRLWHCHLPPSLYMIKYCVSCTPNSIWITSSRAKNLSGPCSWQRKKARSKSSPDHDWLRTGKAVILLRTWL